MRKPCTFLYTEGFLTMTANHFELVIATWRDLRWRADLLGGTKWSPSSDVGQVGSETIRLTQGPPQANGRATTAREYVWITSL